MTTRQAAAAAKPPSRTIVIIEDNEDQASSLADVLALDGHRVEIARDGRSGVDLVRRLSPEIVRCDIGLPDLYGYQIARAIRDDEALRHTRLVALSGSLSRRTANAATQQGSTPTCRSRRTATR